MRERVKQWRQKVTSFLEKHIKPQSIQMTIALSFTIVSVISMGILGISLYNRFVNKMEDMTTQSAEQLLNQTAINLESYLRNMRRISDAMYYSVIKDKDLATDSLDEEMNLLYEANKDNLISIACYTNDGRLVAAAPVATEKNNLDIVDQEWFTEATGQMENVHFSTPHVQNLFDDPSYRYYWVVSLSQAVELTSGGNSTLGVLLVDMNYSSIEQLLTKANTDNASEYVYLMDGSGELIYHPKQKLIYTDLFSENNLVAASYEDGSHKEEYDGEKRIVTVKTISYTGWKIVGVTPLDGMSLNNIKTKLLMVFIIAFVLFILSIINSYISTRITDPIKELEKAVNEIEQGNLEVEVRSAGSYEIQHLGTSIQSMARRIRKLMNDIVAEHESKRRSEFDTLQSQINPHFLYNTLDIIVWMIENEKQSEAVKVVTALARFFRISLSRGKSIITVRDELEHVRNYLMIQHMRYKNKFTYTVDAEDEVLDLASLKLILQPLVENAIYHGMEFMDGDGEIRIRAWRRDKDLYMSVSDNGLGMTREQVKRLFGDTDHVPSGRGSGIGVKNVHQRIRLYFGNGYGLEIQSEPDEGTTVTARLPAIPYGEVKKEGAYVK